jgi:hypothetical protein
MKAVVFFDPEGQIQSVALLYPETAGVNPAGSQIRPDSPQYDSIEIEVEDATPEKLREIHSEQRVDTVRRTLVAR